MMDVGSTCWLESTRAGVGSGLSHLRRVCAGAKDTQLITSASAVIILILEATFI